MPRWLVASVVGPSMVPALYHGDRVLARRSAMIRPGDLVVGRFTGLDRLVVKRAVRPVGGDWYIESVNPYAGGDSAVYGPAEIVARVVCRCWPPRRWAGIRRARIS
ncbi:MAG TPA: S24 family peptidase [Mycobacteriales bacterium]|nr:S24 family peptidase [Mycobacteriales bacterium]